jgi:hypothetical protein
MAVKIRKYNLDLTTLPETSSPFRKGRAPDATTFTIVNNIATENKPIESPEYGTHTVDENSMAVDLQEIMTRMQSQGNYQEFFVMPNTA